jgi:hypothetical protein
MGWDVIISNRKFQSSSVDTDEEILPSFGLRQQVIENINCLFSGIEWKDNQHGHLNSEDYFGNFDLGETEIMTGQFWLGIYGGKNPVNLIVALCNEYSWTAFDTVTSVYINLDIPDNKGWSQFLNFRTAIADRISKSGTNQDAGN